MTLQQPLFYYLWVLDPALVTLGIAILTLVITLWILVTQQRRVRLAEDRFGSLPPVLPPEGIEVPIRASHNGIKGLAPLVSASNVMNPELILFEEHIEYRVMGRQRREYSEIEKVEIYGWARHIRLTFRRGTTFSAYMPNRKILKETLTFFQRKGLTLSDRARELIAQ